MGGAVYTALHCTHSNALNPIDVPDFDRDSAVILVLTNSVGVSAIKLCAKAMAISLWHYLWVTTLYEESLRPNGRTVHALSLYITVQCSKVQCIAVQCNVMHGSALQCNEFQCSLLQCSIVLCSALGRCKRVGWLVY